MPMTTPGQARPPHAAITLIAAITLGSTPARAQQHIDAADADRVLTGEVAGDQFGRSVALVGDVNADGHDDYAVGSRGNAGPGANRGRVIVYSGIDDAVLVVLHGEADSDQFGEALAAAGDVDNDGNDDVIVGAWANSAGGAQAGRAYVFSGNTWGTLHTFTGEAQGDNLGDAVAGAGDVNADGFDDVIIGAPTNDAAGSNAGRVYIRCGRTGDVLRTFEGENINDRLGISVAGAGHVDGDKYADIIMGAHLFDDGNGATDNRGRAYIVAGTTWTPLHTFTGEDAGSNFGWDVASAGDVDNDGRDDVIIGAPLYSDPLTNLGRAYVYSGAVGTLLHTFTGEAASDKVGLSVSAAGDVDHDGHDDILTSAWWYDLDGIPGDNRGRAYIYSGDTGALLVTVTGEAFKDHLGRPVSGGGDINGDGGIDFIVGARDNDAAGKDGGRAYVVFGAPPRCPADVTTRGAGTADPAMGSPDGIVDTADLLHFLKAWAGADPAIADITTRDTTPGHPGHGRSDGLVTDDDINHFLHLWTDGCR